MNGTVKFTREELTTFVGCVFEFNSATVFQEYSHYSQDVRRFGTVRELVTDVEEDAGRGEVHLYYVIHYPECGGFVYKKRITLDPKSCEGHTFRYVMEGWGLIHLQIDMGHKPFLECCVGVNTEARARSWYPLVPEREDPSLWNWPFVKKRTGQLIRRMKKISQAT